MESNLFLVILAIVVIFRIVNSMRRAAGGGGRGGQQVQQRAPAVVNKPVPPEKLSLWDFDSRQESSPEIAGPQAFQETEVDDDPWGVGTYKTLQHHVEVTPAGKQEQVPAGDPWSLERDYRAERSSFVAPSDSITGEQASLSTTMADQQETLPETDSLPRPARQPAGALDLRKVFTRRDPLLTAFIFHEVLQPPPSLRRRR